MTGNVLAFDVLSGGRITIDLGQCPGCETRACVEVCGEQGGPLICDEAKGVPSLRWSLEQVRRGGCVECLGCELACALDGHQAVRIALPLQRFEDHMDSVAGRVVHKAGW
jgi:hypothetical protein